jgi:hypothetical protein
VASSNSSYFSAVLPAVIVGSAKGGLPKSLKPRASLQEASMNASLNTRGLRVRGILDELSPPGNYPETRLLDRNSFRIAVIRAKRGC